MVAAAVGDVRLLRLLVAYEVIWTTSTRQRARRAAIRSATARQLHLALVEALDPAAPISDYYRYHPWRDDGGYLRALVEACRGGCDACRRTQRVRGAGHRLGTAQRVQALNHDPSPERRDAALRAWAEHEFRGRDELRWFELTAGASSSLVDLRAARARRRPRPATRTT